MRVETTMGNAPVQDRLFARYIRVVEGVAKRVQILCLAPALTPCDMHCFACKAYGDEEEEQLGLCCLQFKTSFVPFCRCSFVFGKHVWVILRHDRFDAWAGATLMMAVVPFILLLPDNR